MTRRAFGRRGQLVIPALFVLPSLMLFMYLILETAKLSREKIRHQFAVDSAAFIEMTNYTDLLNRSAYVNGPFPFKLYLEAWPNLNLDASDDSSVHTPGLKVLYHNGIFPAYNDDPMRLPDLDSESRWRIHYDGSTEIGKRLNDNSPGDTAEAGPMGTAHIFTFTDALNYWVMYDHYTVVLWQFMLEMAGTLGAVEDAQIKVYKRLAGNKSFYQKSWMLNTGEGKQTADSSAFDGKQIDVKCIYSSKSGGYGRILNKNPLDYQPFLTKGFGSDPKAKASPPYTNPGSGDFCSGGLFRVAVVDPGQISRLRLPHGVDVRQRWTAPGNYFNVNLNSPRPEVHAKVGVMGCCVWAEGDGMGGAGEPMPTPKFQTRLLP